MARRAVALLAVAAALLAAAAPAYADGDPASDYLLGKPLFVPPDDGVPAANADQLTRVLADAKARGYTVRVALIGSRYDMGSVYELWQHPKLYARFLSQELSFVYKGRVLVVMPNGFGVAEHGKAVPAMETAIAPLSPPGATGAPLANSAARAVQRLAASAGVVVTLPPLSTPSGSTSSDRLKIAIGAGVLVLVAAASFWLRRLLRRRQATG